MPSASEPEPGSVNAQAPIASPEHSRGSTRCFCSAEQSRAIAPTHSTACAPNESDTEPETRASSSMINAAPM